MLKNTGYFRGLECPFRECCRRPYCHFRHRGRAAGNVVTEEARVGAEYDPYSPELPTVPDNADDDVLGAISEPRLDILELERVNKAIEAVKSEVEREQRKYKELLETKKEYNASPSRPSQTDAYSPLEYNPGSCKNGTTDYNPTPLSKSDKTFCKYTLNDSDEGNSKGRFMEYVPTAVAPVSKYKANKYVIDNSKPPTDLEYDPMSNYSARLLSKERERKGTKRCRLENNEETYSPSAKKVCSSASEIVVEAQFSDSEEEIESQSATIKDKKIPSKMKKEVLPTHKATKTGGKDKSSGEIKEMAVQYNMEDIGQLVTNQIKAPFVSKSGSTKEKKGKVHHFVKTKTDTNTGINKADKESVPKKQKPESHKPDKGKSKNHKTDKRSSVKPCSDSSKKEKLVKKLSKEKPVKFEKDTKGGVKNGKYKTKDLKREISEKAKTSTGIIKAKSKQRSLSHVDLFGDESSDEDIKKKKVGSRDARPGSNKGEYIDTEEHCSMQNSKALQRPSTSSVDEIDYSLLEKEVDSDSDPMEECLRVFYESQDVKTEDKGRMANQPQVQSKISEDNLTTLFPGQKKRISHVTNPANEDVPSKPVILPCRRPTPQEMCYLRIQQAQEQAVQLLAQQEVIKLTSTVHKTSLSQPGAKKRIAHVPGLPSPSSQALSPEINKSASVGMVPSPSSLSSAIKTRTLSGMASKTTTAAVQKRQAHAPSLQSSTLKRPVIPTEFGAKVPTTVRQRYLNLFIDECLKLCASQQEAFDKALTEEKVVYSRSTSRNIYLNVAVNTLKKLRNEGPSNNTSSSKSTNKKAVSHEAVLGGKLAAKNSFSVLSNSGHKDEKLSDAALYTKLKDYMLTEEDQQEHGYPMAHPDKAGKALLFNAEEKRNSDSSCRVCCRCGAEYSVSTSGNCVRREECIYHWGRLRRQRGAV